MPSVKIVVPDDFPISYGSVTHPDLERLRPHAGGVTAESSERSNRAPVDNVIAFLEGRPVNVVNR